jgi:uncharacterized surface protein with fasciclin (FAS1) repeats
MVSYQGICEFYNNDYLNPINVFKTDPKKINYPENSIMDYLEKKHKKFAFIAKLAKLDWYLSDIMLRSTLFLPLEESINENILLNMDINTARRIIKYHLMTGLFPFKVINTSPYQELQSTIKGSTITCILYNNLYVLNNDNPIIHVDINLNNGLIHIIQKMLIYS